MIEYMRGRQLKIVNNLLYKWEITCSWINKRARGRAKKGVCSRDQLNPIKDDFYDESWNQNDDFPIFRAI